MHQRLILTIRKPFKCILRGVRFLLAKQTLLSTTSETFSFEQLLKIETNVEYLVRLYQTFEQDSVML